MNKEKWREMWLKKYEPQIIRFDREKDDIRPTQRRGDLWINGREIRVFPISGTIPDGALPLVVKGVESMLEDVGLDFKVSIHEPEEYILRSVEKASDITSWIYHERLLHPLLDESPERNYGCVLVVDSPLPYPFAHGHGQFPGGFALLNISLKYYNNIERIANHETGHLLGLSPHHDVRRQHGVCSSIVRGYREPLKNCNMGASANSFPTTCCACLDALVYFLKNNEKKTGQRFFK